jgi:hypothetical protein
LVIIGYIILIGFIKLSIPIYLNYQKYLAIIAGLFLFLISALRSIEYGSDTINYIERYNSLPYISISEIILNLITLNGKDPFFYLISKVFNLLGLNSQIWLGVIAAFFSFAVYKFIKNYSDDVFISYLALISLGYFYFSLTGLRQTVALSILVLSYKYLRERKLYPFILLVLFGSLFHFSALIFLIAYPMAYVRIGWKQLIGTLIAMGLSVLFGNQVRSIIGLAETLGSYANQQVSLSISGFIIQLCIFLYCLIYRKEIIKGDYNNLSLYNLLFLGLVFQAFSGVIAEFFRISLYFSIFGIILITKALSSERNRKLRLIVYYLVLLSFTSYILLNENLINYRFFWQ